MSKIEVEFKFELGEAVYFRCSPHNNRNRPVQFVVTERIAQECSGGIQQLYQLCDRISPVVEIALTSEEPPYQRPSEATMNTREAEQDREYLTWRNLRRRKRAAEEKENES